MTDTTDTTDTTETEPAEVEVEVEIETDDTEPAESEPELKDERSLEEKLDAFEEGVREAVEAMKDTAGHSVSGVDIAGATRAQVALLANLTHLILTLVRETLKDQAKDQEPDA